MLASVYSCEHADLTPDGQGYIVIPFVENLARSILPNRIIR
jgi:hypothetical protein